MSAPTAQPGGAAATTPTQRLALTRARLRGAWVRTHPPARASKHQRGAEDGGSEGLFSLFTSLLGTWWERHPLHIFGGLAGEVAAPAARAALAPTAEKYPVGLLIGAAAAGALVVAARPWRWLPEAALSSMLLSSLWPKGQLQQWLSIDGLNRLLASGGLAAWLHSFTQTSEPPADGAATAGTSPLPSDTSPHGMSRETAGAATPPPAATHTIPPAAPPRTASEAPALVTD